MDDEYGSQDKGFLAFIEKVNARLIQICGMDSRDLPDYDYWNAYENLLSPGITAREAIRNAGGY